MTITIKYFGLIGEITNEIAYLPPFAGG